MTKQKPNDSKVLLDTIVSGINEVKGLDITILDLRKIETAICKYFVICSGTSNIHVSSISENVKKFVSKKCNEKPWNIEGKNTSEWILMDYSDIVLHVFQKKTRNFYQLEDLWGDANIKMIENL